MAQANITEVKKIIGDRGGYAFAAPLMPPENVQNIEFDGAGKVSEPFVGSFLRFKASAKCSLVFGDDPKPDDKGIEVDPGVVEYFGVTKGQRVAIMAI